MESSLPKPGKFLTIRKRILIIAVFATLVPSLLLGWISYYQTYEVLQAKASQELDGSLERVRRGMDRWIQEKTGSLRVFSGSFVLVENLTRHLRQATTAKPGKVGTEIATEQQIGEFLQLVQEQVPEYQRLLVLNLSGQLVAGFPYPIAPTDFQNDWINQLSQDRMIISEQRSGVESLAPSISMGVPIVSSSAEDLGLLTAEFPMSKLNGILELSMELGSELLLVRKSGEILLSSLSWKFPHARGDFIGEPSGDGAMSTGLTPYRNYRGVDVVSRSVALSRVPWRLIIETPYQSVFAEVDQLRDIALLLTLILLVGFGLLAYLVSQSILLPLSRLTLAAAAVAQGDLSVRLETDNRDELGFTITIFNDMVRRLQVSREKLEKISITDSLTDLYNRKHIMDSLDLQFARYLRSKTRFSVLMADVDHFKQINDQLGHPAGDAALKQIGLIFRNVLRNIDVAGRYGGEEFLIVLEQANEQQALETAERIRSVTEKTELCFEGSVIRFTVSVGVATVADGREETPAALIQRADRSLYMAKRSGRNRVVAAGVGKHSHRLPVG